METLNRLEVSVLERLALKYPDLKRHIPCLIVKDRVVTGVGMYVDFTYREGCVERLDISNASLSTNDNIQIVGLKFGLGYEVDVSEGLIKFIEFVTYGEDWDGVIGDFNF